MSRDDLIEMAHNLSLMEMLEHHINPKPLIESGDWEWSPNALWLNRTKQGREKWWSRHE
jgi:hypothetical protein